MSLEGLGMVALALMNGKTSSHYPEAILSDSLPFLKGDRKARRLLTCSKFLFLVHKILSWNVKLKYLGLVNIVGLDT